MSIQPVVTYRLGIFHGIRCWVNALLINSDLDIAGVPELTLAFRSPFNDSSGFSSRDYDGKKQVYLLCILVNPVFDDMGMINSQIVQNRKYFFIGILDQPSATCDQSLQVHCFLADCKRNFARIGNRGNQVDPFLFGNEPYRRDELIST